MASIMPSSKAESQSGERAALPSPFTLPPSSRTFALGAPHCTPLPLHISPSPSAFVRGRARSRCLLSCGLALSSGKHPFVPQGTHCTIDTLSANSAPPWPSCQESKLNRGSLQLKSLLLAMSERYRRRYQPLQWHRSSYSHCFRLRAFSFRVPCSSCRAHSVPSVLKAASSSTVQSGISFVSGVQTGARRAQPKGQGRGTQARARRRTPCPGRPRSPGRSPRRPTARRPFPTRACAPRGGETTSPFLDVTRFSRYSWGSLLCPR